TYYVNRWTKEMQLIRPRVPLPSALCRFVIRGLDFAGMSKDRTLGSNVIEGLRRMIVTGLPEKDVMTVRVWIEGLEPDDAKQERNRDPTACQVTIRVRAKHITGGEVEARVRQLVESETFQSGVIDMLYNSPNLAKMLPNREEGHQLHWGGLEVWTDESYADSPGDEGYDAQAAGTDGDVLKSGVPRLGTNSEGVREAIQEAAELHHRSPTNMSVRWLGK
ncbi:hypothetical protein FOZ63_015983, partial [Perkinsus olseni]